MDFELSGRTALVTGAGRGIGRETCQLLAKNGANVVVNDIDPEPGNALVSQLEGTEGEVTFSQADVSDESAIAEMIEEIESQFGVVDIVVNNAGIAHVERFRNNPKNDLFRKQLDIHLFGAINCTKHAIGGMIDQGYGKIINMSSIHTKNGVGMSPQYDVAKYSILGLTKTLALELGREGIRVNAVAPGWTKTRMTEAYPEETQEMITALNPLGRFAEPEEIGRAVLFLASPASDYVNGHELRVDGGQQPIDNWRYY